MAVFGFIPTPPYVPVPPAPVLAPLVAGAAAAGAAIVAGAPILVAAGVGLAGGFLIGAAAASLWGWLNGPVRERLEGAGWNLNDVIPPAPSGVGYLTFELEWRTDFKGTNCKTGAAVAQKVAGQVQQWAMECARARIQHAPDGWNPGVCGKQEAAVEHVHITVARTHDPSGVGGWQGTANWGFDGHLPVADATGTFTTTYEVRKVKWNNQDKDGRRVTSAWLTSPRPLPLPKATPKPLPKRQPIAPPLTQPKPQPLPQPEPLRRPGTKPTIAPPKQPPAPTLVPFTPPGPTPTGPDGNPNPPPKPQPPPTPIQQVNISNITIMPKPPQPTLEGIAQEVGNLESKLEALLRWNQTQAGAGLLQGIWDLLQQAFGAMTDDRPGTTWYLSSPCVLDANGRRIESEVVVDRSKDLFDLIEARTDALAALIQTHKDLKQPSCSGNKPTLAGDFVTVHFESASDSPQGSRPLRKVFRYRDQSGKPEADHIDHWLDFEWDAGPVIVIHKGASWGVPQVWAATEAEGKRVIAHAAAIANVDLSQGEWIVTGSANGRVGVKGRMQVQRKGGLIEISKRSGPSGPPLKALS